MSLQCDFSFPNLHNSCETSISFEIFYLLLRHRLICNFTFLFRDFREKIGNTWFLFCFLEISVVAVLICAFVSFSRAPWKRIWLTRKTVGRKKSSTLFETHTFTRHCTMLTWILTTIQRHSACYLSLQLLTAVKSLFNLKLFLYVYPIFTLVAHLDLSSLYKVLRGWDLGNVAGVVDYPSCKLIPLRSIPCVPNVVQECCPGR